MNPLSRMLRKSGGQAETPGVDPVLQQTLDQKRASLASADADTLRQWQGLARRIEASAASAVVSRPRKRIRWVLAGAAAASVGAAVLVIGLLLPREHAPAAYSTGRGEQTAVILPDSTQILLNHTSEVLISQTGGERRVSLKGEAYFRVRRTGEPFLVDTEAGTVRVMGTEFNVRMRDDLLEVALLRGSVSVSSQGKGRESPVVLSPGQTLSVPRGQAPGRPEGILHGEYPGWLHGKLFFQKASLTSVCREIESKFDVTVAIRTPRLAQETITGAIDARTAEAALGTIARLTGSSYKYEKNAYILY